MNEAMINPAIDYVMFDNDQLSLIQEGNEQFVPVKPICTALGLDWETQRRMLERDIVLSSTTVTMTVVAQDKKLREMVCLPLKYLNGWLFKINPSRYEGERLEKIVRYQKECYQVLYQHFFPHSKEQANIPYSKKHSAKLKERTSYNRSELRSLKTDLDMEKLAEKMADRIFKGHGSIEDLDIYPAIRDLAMAALDKLNKGSLFPHDPDQAA